MRAAMGGVCTPGWARLVLGMIAGSLTRLRSFQGYGPRPFPWNKLTPNLTGDRLASDSLDVSRHGTQSSDREITLLATW